MSSLPSFRSRAAVGVVAAAAFGSLAVVGPVAADDPVPTEPPVTAPSTTEATTVPAEATTTAPDTTTPDTTTTTPASTVPATTAATDVAAVAELPVAVDDSATMWANHQARVDVLVNDTVPAGTTVKLWNGTTAVDSISNLYGEWTVIFGTTIRHTPPDGRAGPRSIQYVLTAPDGARSIATLRIQVNTIHQPLAFGDSRTTEYETPITIDVLANDLGGSLPDESEQFALDPSTLRIYTPTRTEVTSYTTTAGTWSVVDGQIQFDPADGFWGNTSIDYRVKDSVRQVARGWVSLHVSPTPDAVDDSATTRQGEPVTLDVTANDFTPPGTTVGSIWLIAPTGLGTRRVEQAGVGVWTYDALQVTFAPVAEFVGDATVRYTLFNNRYVSDSGTVTVTVEAPPAVAAVDDHVDEFFGELRASTTVDVLANDSSEAGATLDPTTLALLEGDTPVAELVVEGEGTWSVVDGRISFNPVDEFIGPATTTYAVGNTAGESGRATVTVGVEWAAVTAVDDADRITFKDVADVDVLANDDATGAELDPATVQLVAPDGTLTDTYTTNDGTWSVVDGAVHFDPVTRFRGTASASYQVDNGIAVGTGYVAVRVVPPGHAGN